MVMAMMVYDFKRVLKMAFEMEQTEEQMLFDFNLLCMVAKTAYKEITDIKGGGFHPLKEHEGKLELILTQIFAKFKSKVYSEGEKHLKNRFKGESKEILTVLLTLVPKIFRVYIREGIIFTHMKLLKSLFLKSTKELPNFAKLSIPDPSPPPIPHFLLLLSIVNHYVDRPLGCLHSILGPKQTHLLALIFEDIFKCQLSSKFLGKKQHEISYGFSIQPEGSDVKEVIRLRGNNEGAKEVISEEEFEVSKNLPLG
jgi:hypothetical protein